ncbi:Patronin [Amphibalanus amphitrite]|uniref:Patronin n=1 Tax=Amphibalanus amphitrite TaxID=1232801 RepID=A0A6A4WUS2_AMPAM|nr:Patronin [Amphibalanus amphitrite]
MAKQRASVRWLVAKAYNNQVPSNLREPYYRDQSDGGERLKPQIVHALANAELYCSCLANIYADPNYHNLSHWGIIQALARKGVYVAEPSDVALTETVLIQTGPIKMSAHMAVMEAIMVLYIRELITAERVVGVVRRFTALQSSTELPADQEEALLLWINKACARLRGQIAAEVREEDTVPRFPLQQDISDLSDGTCLAGLISLYCPDELSWPEIAFSDPPRIADSLYNLQLVEKFCREALPYSPHFLTLEDILYMHSSVKQNLLVLLADLFYLFEINPAKCVRQPGMAKERAIDAMRRQDPYAGSPRRSQPELRRDSLSQAGSVSERLNRDTKWEERGEERRGAASECGDMERNRPAGKPSPRGAGGGRLSRRNSFTEESQLTVENFGGSQDNLQLLGRNPDKQPVVHRGRRESSTHRDLLKESAISFGDRDPFQEAEQERASRSASRASLYDRSESRQELGRPPSRNLFQSDSIKEHFQPTGRRGDDHRADRDDGFRPIDDAGGPVDIDNRVLDALEREARGDSPSKAGNNLVIMFDNNDEQKPTSFAELSKVQPRENAGGINIVYMQHEKEDRAKPAGGARSNGTGGGGGGPPAAAPTTSWGQQQHGQQHGQRHGLPASEGAPEPDMMASELHSIKLRLEEKRRNIEKEKRRMESAMNRQKQNVGKQAFLQAMGQVRIAGWWVC